MNDAEIAMNPNRIVQYLGKPQEEFTKEDLIKFVEENKIEMLNFRHVGGDGRLKTLNFAVISRTQLDRVLSMGERVDGSSLFPYIDAASSDLYIIPRYRTAYVNPFSPIPTIDILCSYYTNEGVRLASSPENILRRAHEALKNSTGLGLEAMGELEYYVLYERKDLYHLMIQQGYEESSPFSKWEVLRCEAMQAIAQAGRKIKYAHSEVGAIPGEDHEMEQDEIEFLPMAIEDAAGQIVIAKWVLRMVGYKYGVTISFAPKISVGHAGSGLHIHTRLVRDGENMMIEGSRLSDIARRAIAGYLKMAPSLTAFGNTVPISYLRLVPHQEAPTNINWDDRNRSVFVRVPLGWLGVNDMIRDTNPQERGTFLEPAGRQTVEFRCPDGSADIHLLLAGLAVAVRHGLEMDGGWEFAQCLLGDREIYQRDGVFPSVAIDGIVKKLRSYDDKDLSERLYGKADEIKKLVEEYLHCS
ncbi:glutamine synthetase family protein [Dehalococcoidia bacterium]|nr:glutamine synthetase family protein [Dehalococcoidia bacterium]